MTRDDRPGVEDVQRAPARSCAGPAIVGNVSNLTQDAFFHPIEISGLVINRQWPVVDGCGRNSLHLLSVGGKGDGEVT